MNTIAREIETSSAYEQRGLCSQHAEESLIGCLLLGEPQTMTKLAGKIFRDDFYYWRTRDIFEVAEELHSARKPIDIVTIAESLDSSNKLSDVGGLVFLDDLRDATPTAANSLAYAQIITSHSRKRKTLSIANRMIEMIDEDSAINDGIRDLLMLDQTEEQYSSDMRQVLQKSCDYAQAAIEGKQIGIPTGLKGLDSILGGLCNSDLIIVGARPSMGKTALALNLMNNGGVPAGLISGEQPDVQIGNRMISIEGRVSGHKLRTGGMSEMDWANFSVAMNSLAKKDFYFYDESSPHIDTVVNQARQWKHEKNIQILYVDYLQLLTSSKDNIREGTIDIAKKLKGIARELDIPVVALAQVNREVDKRPNKRPFAGDLQESGAIEQNADVIIMLYRDDVYADDSPDKGIAELLVEKQRNGPVGFTKVAYAGEYLRFENLAYRDDF